MTSTRLPILLLTALCLATTARAEPPAIRLSADRPVDGTIDPADGFRSFTIQIPADCIALSIEVEEAATDVDLAASHGVPVERAEEFDVARMATPEVLEVLVLSRFGDVPLRTGRYHIDVELGLGAVVTDEPIPFVLRARLFRARVDAAIEPGTVVRQRLDPASGSFRILAVDVPAGAEALRVDLDGADGDVDLFAGHGAPPIDLDEAAEAARTILSRESLVIERPAAGRWHLLVVDAFGEDPLDVDVHVGLSREVPDALRPLPVLEEPGSPMARAVLATVEVLGTEGGGSGTVLDPSGLILTNHHVIVGPDGHPLPDGEVVIALSIDPTRPPVESFRARVVEADAEIDLALVQIVSGLHGQPLPTGYRLVALELGDPGGLAIGTPLSVLGYPANGSSGSRVSITLTRGVVSGFERRPFGLVLKTDADIAGGNSGGAALDPEGRLVGVPTYVVPEADGNAQMGFVHSIDILPAAWRSRIGRRD